MRLLQEVKKKTLKIYIKQVLSLQKQQQQFKKKMISFI